MKAKRMLEGKTSKEYIESLKAHLIKNEVTRRIYYKAQNPDNSITQTENLTHDSLLHIREELALYFANFATEYGFKQYEVGMVDLARYQVKVQTLNQCKVLNMYNYYILVTIHQLVTACPPTCLIELPDARSLIDMFVF